MGHRAARLLARAGIGETARFYLRGYLHMLTGSSGRLLMQAVYFAILINVLSLGEYGIFASALAAAIILGSGGELGYVAPAFRAATARPRVVGAHMAGLYVYSLLSLPVTMVLALAAHALLFDGYMSLHVFAAIVLAETFFVRLSDTVIQVTMGLNRYRLSSMLLLVNPLARMSAVAVFWLLGDGSLEQWSALFLIAAIVTLAVVLLFAPAMRLRWKPRLFAGRFREALAYEATSLSLGIQSEADKILMLGLTSPELAGLYALTMRVIELISTPVRSFHRIYTQMLMRNPAWLVDFPHAIRVETAMAVITTVVFLGFLAVLSLHPTALGSNIAAGHAWFAGLVILPAAKMLTDFHREVLFAAKRLVTSAVISAILTLVKLAGLTVIVTGLPDHDSWVLALDALFACLYLISLALVWSWGLRPLQARPPAAAVISQPV